MSLRDALRSHLCNNMFDGDDSGGQVTMRVSDLLDEVSDNVVEFLTGNFQDEGEDAFTEALRRGWPFETGSPDATSPSAGGARLALGPLRQREEP